MSGGFLYGSRIGMVFSRDSLGGLQRSVDNGASWIPANGIDPQNTLYAMAEDSAGLLYAGTYNGIFTSIDSGASWNAVLAQETWCLAVNAAGYLFRGDYGGTGLDGAGLSKNGGASWRDVTSGLGGHEGVTSYAILPNGRIFAGTVDGSVFRSANSSLPVLLSGFTGTPVAARKTAPACGLRGCPFRMLLFPKLLIGSPGTGRTKGPVHSLSGVVRATMSRTRSVSLRILSRVSGGGVTYFSSTLSRRSGKALGPTRQERSSLAGRRCERGRGRRRSPCRASPQPPRWPQSGRGGA